VASVPVKGNHDRKSVATFIKKPPRRQPPRDRRLPPEDSLAQPSGSFLHDPIDLFEKLFLTLRSFREGPGSLFILGWHPVISGLHNENGFFVLLGHEDHVFAEIIQASVPPGIKRLPDHVELDMVRSDLVEELLGLDLVTTLIDA